MKALLVGADTLGNIPDVLAEFGIAVRGHLTGRHSAHQRRSNTLPADTDLVILFTDFLGHNVMKHFRALAGQRQHGGKSNLLAAHRFMRDDDRQRDQQGVGRQPVAFADEGDIAHDQIGGGDALLGAVAHHPRRWPACCLSERLKH